MSRQQSQPQNPRHLPADRCAFHTSTCPHPNSWPACARVEGREGLGRGPSRLLSGAALRPLSSGPAHFTCSYYHRIVLRFQTSPGVGVSSSPSRAGRGAHGPAEPSATCSHFCPGLGQEFACKQLFVPLQAGGGAGRKQEERRSCSPAAVLGPGP